MIVLLAIHKLATLKCMIKKGKVMNLEATVQGEDVVVVSGVLGR